MANNTYRPSPIDISLIELESHLYELTEILAQHAHDIWAEQRIMEGWSWGESRCDQTKKHPCLVPYDELPETEKEYDRRASMGTIKAILALGYHIEQPTKSSG